MYNLLGNMAIMMHNGIMQTILTQMAFLLGGQRACFLIQKLLGEPHLA